LRGQRDFVQTSKAGDDPKDFGSPPASTELGYQACNCGLRGWPRRSCDAYRLRPHPRGRRGRPLFAITQARNTSAIFAAVTPRGCRVPCWVTQFRETEPSPPVRSWPHRVSVTPLYSVTLVTARVNRLQMPWKRWT